MGSFEDDIDVTVPSEARVYDWLLGGSINFEADRRTGAQLLQIAPTSRELALTNRRFLQRVVHTLATEYGIRQFLDLGSGLPTQNNVHQIVQRVHPSARVVYVDKDPVVIAYGRASLDENEHTALLEADVTDTGKIFAHPAVDDLIHRNEPTAVLLVSVLHCIPDEAQPAELIRRVVDLLAPGSFMVICQPISEDPEVRRSVTELMVQQTGGRWGQVRQERDVQAYFEDLEVQPPGLVDVADWRPDNELHQHRRSREWTVYGGLARVR